jgi:hypothetical protein
MTLSLEVPQNNLFINGYISSFDDGEVLEREPIVWTATNEDHTHTVKEGDRLDLLAWKFYKNKRQDASKYWWVIADTNLIADPTNIAYLIGEEIIIPNIDKFTLML